MRRMSFAMTKEKILDQTKTQTRRLGWSQLAIGTVLRPVEKSMGLRKGEKVKDIGDYDLRVTNFWQEPLTHITQAECAKEGFPDINRTAFIRRFCDAMKCTPQTMVNVIEFEYIKREED